MNDLLNGFVEKKLKEAPDVIVDALITSALTKRNIEECGELAKILKTLTDEEMAPEKKKKNIQRLNAQFLQKDMPEKLIFWEDANLDTMLCPDAVRVLLTSAPKCLRVVLGMKLVNLRENTIWDCDPEDTDYVDMTPIQYLANSRLSDSEKVDRLKILMEEDPEILTPGVAGSGKKVFYESALRMALRRDAEDTALLLMENGSLPIAQEYVMFEMAFRRGLLKVCEKVLNTLTEEVFAKYVEDSKYSSNTKMKAFIERHQMGKECQEGGARKRKPI